MYCMSLSIALLIHTWKYLINDCIEHVLYTKMLFDVTCTCSYHDLILGLTEICFIKFPFIANTWTASSQFIWASILSMWLQCSSNCCHVKFVIHVPPKYCMTTSGLEFHFSSHKIKIACKLETYKLNEKVTS